MPNRCHVPVLRSALLAFGLTLTIAALPTAAAAQTQPQVCFFAEVITQGGPRFLSDVFCVFGSVDGRDVGRSFRLWASNRYASQVDSWGSFRVVSHVYPAGGRATSVARANAARNNAIARYGASLSATPGWTYYPGAAQLAEALSGLGDAIDNVLVDNGIGASMATAHGESWALTFGGSVRFGGRWRFHAYNPIELLSPGEQRVPSEGRDLTMRQGWGMEILRNFTPYVAVGLGAHHVRVMVERRVAPGDFAIISDKTYWDPTISFTLPLGYLPLQFRYGQRSQFSLGMIVDFEK
jgi:hypothetical protein